MDLKAAGVFERYLAAMCDELDSHVPPDAFIIGGLTQLLLHELSRRAQQQGEGRRVPAALRAAQPYISRNLYRPVRLDELCQAQCHLSISQFSALFTRCYGISPMSVCGATADEPGGRTSGPARPEHRAGRGLPLVTRIRSTSRVDSNVVTASPRPPTARRHFPAGRVRIDRLTQRLGFLPELAVPSGQAGPGIEAVGSPDASCDQWRCGPRSGRTERRIGCPWPEQKPPSTPA